MSLGQLIYTSSRYSLDAPMLGLHNEPGFHIYACSNGFTKEELYDFLKYKEYELPAELLSGIGLPDKEFSPEVPSMFPKSFSFFRLNSGKYVIMQSCYSGVEYSGRRGNTFSHAIVFDRLPQHFNPVKYINSPSFRTGLTQLEALDIKVDYLESLEEFRCGYALPGYDENYAKWVLNVVAKAFENGKSVNLCAEPDEITSFLNVVFSMLPHSLVQDLYFTTFLPSNLPVDREHREIFRIAGTGRNRSNINNFLTGKLGYMKFESGTVVTESYVYDFLIYAKRYSIDDRAFREMGIDSIEKLAALAKVYKRMIGREALEGLSELMDATEPDKLPVLIVHLFAVYVYNNEMLGGFRELWGLVKKKIDYDSLPNDVRELGMKLMVESILNGASYSTADIIGLRACDVYCRTGTYFFSDSFLSKLDARIKAEELKFHQLEQVLLALLICSRYDLQCSKTFYRSKTVLFAFEKFVTYVKFGAVPVNKSVLLYSTVFLNDNEAEEFCKQYIFQIFTAKDLGPELDLVDTNTRENVAYHILDILLSHLTTADVNVHWDYLEKRDMILSVINNLKCIQNDNYIEDIISSITGFYEYTDNGNAILLNNAFMQLLNTSERIFEKIVPDMFFSALQLPYKKQDILVNGMEFGDAMWSGYMDKIALLFGQSRPNINAVANYVAFFHQNKARLINEGWKNDIENTIVEKLNGMTKDWHFWFDIWKLKKMLKSNYGILIDFKKKGFIDGGIGIGIGS